MNPYACPSRRGSRVLLAASLVLLALLTIAPANAEEPAGPALAGKVREGDEGKAVPFASVALFREDVPAGTPEAPAGGALTKTDGSFRLPLAPGSYRAVVSHVAYQSLRVGGIVVRDGDTTRIDLELIPNELRQKIVDVTGERIENTDLAILTKQRKAAVVSDGVSAELIKRTPDASAADVLRRVSGLYVVDDKYVYIRGVTDRYNVATLDGVKVSSTDTDTDKRSFAFDLVPGSLLSNTVVVKTATPDLPGDFSGGLVQVNTLDFPSSRLVKLSISPGYNETASEREIQRSGGSSTDWRATDDGIRSIPGDLRGDDLARALPNSWAARSSKAPLNGSYGLSYGDRLSFGRHDFGVIGSLSYKQSYQKTDFVQEPSFMGYPLFRFKGSRSSYSVLWAGLLNLSYSPARGHEFSLRNSRSQNARDQVSVSEGLPASGEYARRQTIQWTERTLFSTQLTGSHDLSALHDLGIEWKVFRSSSDADEPDRKHVEFERAGDLWSLKENYRTWSSLHENSLGASTDFRLPLGSSELKAGVFTERRKRDYEIDAYTTDPAYLGQNNYGLLVLPLDSIFLPENYGPGKFRFSPLSRFTGEYDGKEEIQAYYGMADHPFSVAGQRFRAAGGVRVERSLLFVNTVKAIDDPTPITAREDVTETLPSVNFTYMPAGWANLRLAYGRSINRPELRELANVLYYDFEREQNVIGNPELRHALIDNYDARIEAFPGADQVIAFSVFHKRLNNAIEERLLPSPERFVRTWFNSDGHNEGWEADARKSLGFVHRWFSGLSMSSNYSRVYSSIQYTEKVTDSSGNPIVLEKARPMQGQAPWTLNVSLLYSAPRLGSSVHVLMNRAGRRLNAVGDSRDTDVYEETRDVFDLAFSQRLSARLDLKFAVKNVTGVDKVLTSGPDRSLYSRDSGETTYALSIGASL
jgi:hypothetical protein